MTSPSAALMAGLAGPLGALGVDVEEVDVQKAGRRHVVRIIVDRDGGVDLDLVAAVSHRASELLDEPPLADALPGPFVLEVSSPGVDRPLTEPRHWRRALTRLVHVTLADGRVIEGRIVDVPSGDEIVLDTSTGEVTLARADVQRAQVQVEFNRTDAGDAADDDVAEDDQEQQGKH